jgi:hypothetical protein
MTPVVSFVTFSVYKALHGQLDLPSVFYALSLLHLPKLYLVYFAVIGFQYLTETFVALQRIDKFLGMPEPPPAVHMRARQQRSQSPAAAATAAQAVLPVSKAAGGAGAAADGAANGQQQQLAVVAAAAVDGSSDGSSNGVVVCDLPDGYVELGGADYDWASNIEEMASQVRMCGRIVQRSISQPRKCLCVLSVCVHACVCWPVSVLFQLQLWRLPQLHVWCVGLKRVVPVLTHSCASLASSPIPPTGSQRAWQAGYPSRTAAAAAGAAGGCSCHSSIRHLSGFCSTVFHGRTPPQQKLPGGTK